MFKPLFGDIDTDIVVAVNNCHSVFMDKAILTITDFWFFVLVICAIFAYSFYKETTPKALLFCVLLLVAVGCADFLSAGIIRPALQQLRPSNPDNPVHSLLHIVRGYTGGTYGFPSCHAANSSAIAVFTFLWYRVKKIAFLLIVWAMLECYTRMYLGVHYPSDILGGLAIGSLTAFCIYLLSRASMQQIRTRGSGGR